MGAFQHPVGGLQNPSSPSTRVQRSFKDALEIKSSKSNLFFTQPESILDPAAAQIGKHKGLPAISFSKAHIQHISSSFNWVLIGKFSKGYNKQKPQLGRPSMEILKKHFDSIDFHGAFQIGLMDNRHLLIQFQMQEDYLRMYSTPVWHIKGIPMRILKWTNRFHVDREIPVAPVWIGFPRLPIHYFEHKTIFAIAGLVGSPLRIDSATATLKRPSIAFVQVEVNLLEEHPDKIWISVDGETGFWQIVEYDRIPDYCQHCWHIGHLEECCHVRHPELKNAPKPDSSNLKLTEASLQITAEKSHPPSNQVLAATTVTDVTNAVKFHALQVHEVPLDKGKMVASSLNPSAAIFSPQMAYSNNPETSSSKRLIVDLAEYVQDSFQLPGLILAIHNMKKNLELRRMKRMIEILWISNSYVTIYTSSNINQELERVATLMFNSVVDEVGLSVHEDGLF